MAITLSSSSDDDLVAARLRPTSTMILSDSSDDDVNVLALPTRAHEQVMPPPSTAAPRLVDSAAAPRPFAPPPHAGGAARKSSLGRARLQPRRTLVTKHGAPQPSQRPSTLRTVVKPEPDDDDEALAAVRALRSEGSIANALDPRLEAIPYPFDVSIRLEEIRLALKKEPTRPVVKLDVAFRHVDQSSSSATSAASTSFPLPVPPHFAAGSLVAFALPDRLSTHSFHVPGNPSIPLDAPDPPSSSSASSRRLPRPDVRDVLIRVSIVDSALDLAPEKLYDSATAMTEGSRLSLSGERALRRSAAGSQVAVSWRVELENDGSRPGPATDEVLEKWLEQEMRRCETEWRNEVAERALRQVEIEAHPHPAYGPPRHLVLDPTAPSPAGLIPGLAADVPPLAQPVAFAPIPRYHYTGFASRGVPLVGSLLESFPQTKHWEDPSAANAHVAERVLQAFDPGSDDEDERGQDPDKAERERAVESEWRTKNLVEYGSFDAPDPGRTTRDFAVLKRLLSHLKVDLVELAQLEREAKAQDDLENRVELDHFAFERSFDEGHVLRRALKLFEERTGRSAFQVQQEYRLIDDEQIITADESADCCWLCGAYLCSVHAGTLCSYNEPTKAPFDPTEHERDGCPDCGSSTCLYDAQQVRNEAVGASVDAVQDALKKVLLDEDMPPLDPCTASLLLQRSLDTDQPSSEARSRRSRAKNNESNKWHKLELPPNQSSGYSPCDCVDRCSADCLCVEAKTYCDRWCACPPSCSRRFRGCVDHDCAVSSKCWCLDRSRQCDPQICGCNAATCSNSAIRLGRRKATAVVRSQIPGGGFGAILLEPATKDESVDLYGGELHPQGLTDSPTMESKWGHWRATFADGVEHSYWFDVDGGDAIDSLLLGNVIRCVNHDRERANVVPRIVNVAGTHQIALYTLRDLEAGDELLLDYGEAYLEPWMERGGGS
ncbi:hypothetical protein JCM3775_007336 [Rhodotorula graminis]